MGTSCFSFHFILVGFILIDLCFSRKSVGTGRIFSVWA